MSPVLAWIWMLEEEWAEMCCGVRCSFLDTLIVKCPIRIQVQQEYLLLSGIWNKGRRNTYLWAIIKSMNVLQTVRYDLLLAMKSIY